MLVTYGARSMNVLRARLSRKCIQQVSVCSIITSKPCIGSYPYVSLQCQPQNLIPRLHFCTKSTLDDVSYERISDDTLEALTEYLEELVEEDSSLVDGDVLYSTGVLTLNLGDIGTYVINKQSPNKQIWFSSPFSGPKRYDFIDGAWIYKHDGVTLHQMLSEELSEILKKNIDLSVLAYGRK